MPGFEPATVGLTVCHLPSVLHVAAMYQSKKALSSLLEAISGLADESRLAMVDKPNGNRQVCMYTRLQTVWWLPGHSRQANKDHSPRCHRRPNGPGRLADKVVQPTTQSGERCTL